MILQEIEYCQTHNRTEQKILEVITMKNMMKEYLGTEYSDNHLRNFCLYWTKGYERRDREAFSEV